MRGHALRGSERVRIGVAFLGLAILASAARAGVEARQEVRDDWDYQYRTMGTPYTKRAPKDWNKRLHGINLLANDSNAPTEEPYLLDRHAAFWPTDRDQCDVVYRRTEALLRLLARDNPNLAAQWRKFGERLAKLKERLATTKPDRDGADPARKALYVDLCALRREIVLSNPLLDFEDVLFNEISDSGMHLVRPTDTPQFANPCVYPGGGLYVIKDWKSDRPTVVDLCANARVENGPYKGRCLSNGCFHSPSLSYDGRTVYFSWADPNAQPDSGRNRGPGRYSHIFRVGIDGAGLRQLTFGPYNDFDCSELPGGRLVFMSTRREGYDRCIAYRPASFLHSMKPDGSDIICLSFFETHEWEPSVDNDGMIVYSRWDYVDRHVHSSHAFWRCYPDGRDSRAPHGNYYFPLFDPRLPTPAYAGAVNLAEEGNSRKRGWENGPVTELSIRAIPATRGKYVAVAAGHHNPSHGTLIMIDLNKADDYRHSQIARITQNRYATDGDQPSESCLWSSPWPLSESFYLANYLDRIYVIDRFGNRELVYHMAKAAELNATRNPALTRVNQERRKAGKPPVDRLDLWEFAGNSIHWRPVWPKPVRATPPPPVIAPQTYQSADRRSKPGHKPATLAVMNVYDTDVPLPPDTKVKYLRLVQILATSSGQYKRVSPGNQGATVSRLPLGVVCVEEDGSVYCEAPIERGFYFQLLNEDGLAVQSMRSLTYVHPGEHLACVGCHEPYDRTPDLAPTVPLAMRRSPSKIQPEFPEGVVPPDYEKQIVPIFESVCIACHTKQGKGPRTVADVSSYLRGHQEMKPDGSKGRRHPPWVRWGWTANSGRGFARTVPGHCGALNSPLWNHVQKNVKAFTPEQRKRLGWWVDLSCPLAGGYNSYYTEPINGVRWPIHQDVDPWNPLGIERPGGSGPTSAELAEEAARATGQQKAALLEALARRDPCEHIGVYVAGLTDKNDAVRRCSLRVVKDLAGAEVLPRLGEGLAGAESHDEADLYEKTGVAICSRVADKQGCVRAIAAWLPKATPPGKCAILRLLGCLGGKEALGVVRKVLAETKPAPANLAPQAKAAATSELKGATAARFAVDGRVPDKGSRADDNAAWAANGRTPLPVTFTLTWDRPVRIAQVVYYGRTAWDSGECWKDYELYVDDASAPAAKGRFTPVHGPQSVRLPKPVQARKLTLKFLTSHGGANPGASEIKVFSEAVADLDAAEVRATAEGLLLRLAGAAPSAAHR